MKRKEELWNKIQSWFQKRLLSPDITGTYWEALLKGNDENTPQEDKILFFNTDLFKSLEQDIY